jgi:SHS2 domain-containing protein
VIGRGANLPEAFAQVALGVFALLVDPATVEERDVREVRAHGTAPETLLVNWVNECLYVLDVEGFVARRVEFTTFALDPVAPGGEPLRLHSRLHGEDLDPVRHVPRDTVRGISGEGVGVLEAGDESEARIIVQGGNGQGAWSK